MSMLQKVRDREFEFIRKRMAAMDRLTDREKEDREQLRGEKLQTLQ